MIRPAGLFDLAQIMAMDEGAGLPCWSRGNFESILEGSGRMLVEVEQERVVAYAVFQVIPPEAELLRIVVDPTRRGQGIGASFLDACLHELVSNGVESFFLEVRESNRAGCRLYQRCGFRASGRRVDYYRTPVEDAILMRLDIESSEKESR